MPVFRDPRTRKTVSIPEIKDSEINIWTNLLWGDLEDITKEEESDVSRGMVALTKLIINWNLTDENGNKLPINKETLCRFTPDMISFLLSQTDFKQDEDPLKKKT